MSELAVTPQEIRLRALELTLCVTRNPRNVLPTSEKVAALIEGATDKAAAIRVIEAVVQVDGLRSGDDLLDVANAVCRFLRTGSFQQDHRMAPAQEDDHREAPNAA